MHVLSRSATLLEISLTEGFTKGDRADDFICPKVVGGNEGKIGFESYQVLNNILRSWSIEFLSEDSILQRAMCGINGSKRWRLVVGGEDGRIRRERLAEPKAA